MTENLLLQTGARLRAAAQEAIEQNSEETLGKTGNLGNKEEGERFSERQVNQNEEQKEDEKPPKLLRIEDMPEHLQFNPFIRTGYRPLQTPAQCIKSCFQWHNETINIITHAIPIFYILLTVPDVLPWHSFELSFLACCHIAGILCPWMGSLLYHMFMSLDSSPMAYYILLQVDMLGIWVSQSFGAFPMVFATAHCLPETYKYLLVAFYCLLSIYGLYKAMIAWTPWDRRFCFLLPFITRVFLWGLRIVKSAGHPDAFVHVILQDVVSIAGGCIGAIHVPEKWFPGCVDFCLNSHNIMHVLVVAAVWSMHQATVLDLHWMATATCAN